MDLSRSLAVPIEPDPLTRSLKAAVPLSPVGDARQAHDRLERDSGEQPVELRREGVRRRAGVGRVVDVARRPGEPVEVGGAEEQAQP